jgi:hypothetical protein
MVMPNGSLFFDSPRVMVSNEKVATRAMTVHLSLLSKEHLSGVMDKKPILPVVIL